MTTKIDVGTPPRGFRRWESVDVCFHNFADDPAPRGTAIQLPDYFTCLGHHWDLLVYPRGDEESLGGWVAVHLIHRSDECLEIDYQMIIKDLYLDDLARYSSRSKTFYVDEYNGSEDFAKRTPLLEKALVNGTLTIEVRMRLSKSSAKSMSVSESSAKSISADQFIPCNPINKNILSTFMKEESSDVVFEVGPADVTKSHKKAKLSPVNFCAHRFILHVSAPALAEMCEDGEKVYITDMDPDIFRLALRYAYGGKLSDEDMQANAKEIIDAADIFGMANLKLEAEASYVNSAHIDLDNMMDNLFYADAKNCALLKEAVIDFVVENSDDVLKKVCLKDVPGGMFADLLTAMTRGKKAVSSKKDDPVNIRTMRVSELRAMLDEKGLEVDGSRESMIKMLKGNSTRDNADNVGQD